MTVTVMKTMWRWSLRHGLALDGRASQGSVRSCKLYLCVFGAWRGLTAWGPTVTCHPRPWTISTDDDPPERALTHGKILALTIHKLALVETMFSSGYTPWVTIRSGTPPCPWHGVHHGRPPGRQSSFWNHPGHGCIHQVLELHPLWCEVAVAFVSESAAPGVLPNYQLLPTTRRYYPYWATYDLEACLVRRPISAMICVIYHGPPVSVQQPELLPWQVDQVHMGPGGYRGCQDHGRPQVVLSHSLGIGWGTG